MFEEFNVSKYNKIQLFIPYCFLSNISYKVIVTNKTTISSKDNCCSHLQIARDYCDCDNTTLVIALYVVDHCFLTLKMVRQPFLHHISTNFALVFKKILRR